MEACKFCCASGGVSVIIKPPKLSLRCDLGVAKLDINNVYAYSFILSTKTFLRNVCSPRYCVKKFKFFIPLFLGHPVWLTIPGGPLKCCPQFEAILSVLETLF